MFVQAILDTYAKLKNTLQLSGYPTSYDIARGKISGSRQATIEGFRTTIPSGVSDVTNLSTSQVPIPPLSGISMSIVSTSANDTLAGVNARKVILEYIDPTDLKLKQVEINLNGTTPVAVPVSVAFVSDFYVSETASLSVSNAGNITIYNGATVYATIKTGDCKSLNCFRYIPIDKNFYIKSLDFSGDTKGILMKLEATQTDNLTKLKTFVCRSGAVMSDAPTQINFDPPMVIVGGNYVKCTISGGANSGTAGACINGWLENKDPSTLNK